MGQNAAKLRAEPPTLWRKPFMAKDSKQVTGYLYVLAAAVLWSLIGPFSKICMEEGLAPLEVAFWRALLGGICFFAQTGIFGGARIPVKLSLIHI